MDSLCLFVREMSPRTYHLWGILHPAVILHLRVKTQLVSRLSLALRRDYRGLFSAKTIARRPLSHYGLSGMVAPPPPGPAPPVRAVVIDRHCHPADRNAWMFHHLRASYTRLTTLRRKMRPVSREMPTMQGKCPSRTRARVPFSLGSPEAGASFAPNQEYSCPPPGALAGGYVERRSHEAIQEPAVFIS